MKQIFQLLLPAIFVATTLAQDPLAPSIQELMSQAKSGDASAQEQLGRAYQEGKGVAQSDTEAVSWYRKAADQGNAMAQNRLGVMYALGRGVSPSKEEAVRFYKKAARQGLPQAEYNMATSYFNGEGVVVDFDLAYAWMMIAKDQGDVQAGAELKHVEDELHGRVDGGKFKLASLYDKGDEIAQNIPAAVALYRELGRLEARQSSYAGASQYRLCQLYAAGRGVDQDAAQATSWCKKAIRNGASSAYLVLGIMAEQGIGGEKNPKEAARLYQEAALAGQPQAFLYLGTLKSQSALHQDQVESYFWLYTGQTLYPKLPDFTTPLQNAMTKLSDSEVAQQQQKANEWLKTRGGQGAALRHVR